FSPRLFEKHVVFTTKKSLAPDPFRAVQVESLLQIWRFTKTNCIIWIILLSLSVAFSPSLAEEIESTLGETPDGQGRFFFVPKTVTDLIKTTTTTSGGLQSWCYTVVSLISVVSTVEQSGTKDIGQATFTINSVGACRKRRWAFEDPFDESLKEILLPSAVAAKEDRATAVALD
ncbi:hypothetical protein QYM36_012795, partial [Artemia franciscana]